MKNRPKRLLATALSLVSLSVILVGFVYLLLVSEPACRAAVDGKTLEPEFVQDYVIRVMFWAALMVVSVPFAYAGGFLTGVLSASRTEDRGEQAVAPD